MNKPLTKEELEGIKWILEYRGAPVTANAYKEVAVALSSAEAYWREAVKNASGSEPNVFGRGMNCPFCRENGFGSPYHRKDCPWLIAQGGK